MKQKRNSGGRGRPRSFDLDAALDRAVEVFWRRGYEGASLSELTKAMRINRPSLYAAFGDKEALFRKAIERYANRQASYITESLAAPTAREAVDRLLYRTAEQMCGGKHPAGCLLVQGALASGDAAESVRRALALQRDQARVAVHQRLRRAKKEGDLPADSDPAALARYVITIVNGMAVQGSGGASPNDLRRVADMALLNWPKSGR